MKHLAYTLGIAGLVGAMGTVTLAQSDMDTMTDPTTVTCADFTAMSAEEQRSTLDEINLAQADSDMDASTDIDASADTDMGADDTATADTETDLSAGAGADTGDMSSDTAETDPEVEAVIAACEGNDEALVVDHLPES